MKVKNIIITIFILAIVVAMGLVFLGRGNQQTPDIQTTSQEEGGTNFFTDLFKFSSLRRNNDDQNRDQIPEPQNLGVDRGVDEEGKEMFIYKVSSVPVAGFTVFQKERFFEIADPDPVEPALEEDATFTAPPTEFAPALRYVDKRNGNIYQTFVDVINERKFSDTVVPVVHEAMFAENGQVVIMRYIQPGTTDTIETFVGALPEETLGADSGGDSSAQGSFLPEDITQLSVAPDTGKIFYLYNTAQSAIGTTALPLGSNKIQVFDSAFTEWLVQWANPDAIMLTTKPANGIPGYMYRVNPNRKDFNKVLGDIDGLTTLASPNDNMILYANDNLEMSVYNRQTGDIQKLNIKTMPEKCVWGGLSETLLCAVPKSTPTSGYPDSWYRGEVGFIDDIWTINTNDGSENMILNPTFETGEEVDAINLQLDESEKYLFFMNKKDSYLWKAKIK